MPAPLHTLDPTSRFTSRADDYRRYRPSYPPAAIDAILDGLADPRTLLAADIGAGTGISTRLLADRGVRIIAIEPNAAMRAAAEPHPHVEWRDGTAERTGLADASIDLALCAQAFHWFRAPEALAEFARILRPAPRSGRLALMWNIRNDEGDAFTGVYGAAVKRHATDAAAHKDPDAAAIAASPAFGPVCHLVFPYQQTLDWPGLLGRATSASYVPSEGPALALLTADLKAAYDAHRDPEGRVRLVYRTEVFLAERA
jgi:SAM-dependent methyltransferase